MKKYIKPELYFESFTLSQHIADCAWELNSTESNCSALADPDYLGDSPSLFMSTANGCSMTTDVYQAYCYHDGAQGANVFAS